MIAIKHPQQLAQMRRTALAAQGLLQAQPFGRGLSGARKAIAHLGYVQIDTISVVERAHHHVLYSRVPDFKPDMTNQLLTGGDIFEYWSHAAAFLPMGDFRFSLPYKHAIKSGQHHWFKNPDKKLMRELLARIRADGPLRSRDLETEAKKGSGWWDWKPAKKALEQLYMEGELMVSSREGFQKMYDLSERVLPAGVNTTMPSTEEFAAHLVDQQLRCHGLASLKGLTYLRRNPPLRKAVKAIVDSRVDTADISPVKLASGEVFFIATHTLNSDAPRLNKRLRILSPFDNSVIQRDRLSALFSYDYQIECYVPAAKRRYGYFCLPLLYGDTFVGRMDCKAHRKNKHLEIKALYFEPHNFKEDAVLTALVDALKTFCEFQGCNTVSITAVFPKHLSAKLQSVKLHPHEKDRQENR